MSTKLRYDSVVIGGGPAGLSAALVLGRALRQTLVLDSGEYRNAPADHIQSFLTRDGIPPTEFRALGQQELDNYETVTYREGRVTAVEERDAGFVVSFADEQTTARTIILATGVTDRLPDIDGIDELWGSSVLLCPYCHGYEVRDESFAVYVPDPDLLEYVKIIRQWSEDLTVLTDGETWLDDNARDRLEANGIAVYESSLDSLEGSDEEVTISFENGEQVTRRALWVVSEPHQRSQFAETLGCSVTNEGFVETDEYGRTSVNSVYVAGDAGRREVHQVSFAVSDGAIAAITANHELCVADFENR